MKKFQFEKTNTHKATNINDQKPNNELRKRSIRKITTTTKKTIEQKNKIKCEIQ